MRNVERNYVGFPISEHISGRDFYDKELSDRYFNTIKCSERYLQSDSIVEIHKTIFLPINITSLMTQPTTVQPDNKLKNLIYKS